MPVQLDTWTRPHCVYRHWDAQGSLLYVGCTGDPEQRWHQHRTSPWRDQVAASQVTWFPSAGYAYIAEWVAIHTEQPVYNRGDLLMTRMHLTHRTPPAPKPKTAAQWIPCKEACERLAITRRHLDRLVATGSLLRININLNPRHPTYRIKVADVDALLAQS